MVKAVAALEMPQPGPSICSMDAVFHLSWYRVYKMTKMMTILTRMRTRMSMFSLPKLLLDPTLALLVLELTLVVDKLL